MRLPQVPLGVSGRAEPFHPGPGEGGTFCLNHQCPKVLFFFPDWGHTQRVINAETSSEMK